VAAPLGGVGTVGRRREVWGGLVGERGGGWGGVVWALCRPRAAL
jgi:hypothetical protein